MQALAEYVMRGRKQAIWLALLFAFLPFLGWVADAIVALVTLRKGAKEGAIVLLWAVLPAILVSFAGFPQLWIYNILGGSLVTYVLAVVLRHYGSWGMVLQAGMIIGVFGVFAAHIIFPDLTAWWVKEIVTYLQHAKTKSFLGTDANIQLLAKIGTGLQAVFLLLGDFFNLVMARWAQAMLYNPQGLKPELLSVRLGLLAVVVFICIIVLSALGVGSAIDALPVAFITFLLAGISLVQCFLSTKKYSTWVVILFYGLLIVLFPYLMGIIISLAIMDIWWDLRRYFSKISNSKIN